MEGIANINYQRVCPRDLFNEAKLLKNLGRLVVLIHDGIADARLDFQDDGDPFEIGLHNAGYLTVTNGLMVTYRGRQLWLGIPYNDRSEWPLICHYQDVDWDVFDYKGSLSDDFQYMLTLI